MSPFFMDNKGLLRIGEFLMEIIAKTRPKFIMHLHHNNAQE